MTLGIYQTTTGEKVIAESSEAQALGYVPVTSDSQSKGGGSAQAGSASPATPPEKHPSEKSLAVTPEELIYIAHKGGGYLQTAGSTYTIYPSQEFIQTEAKKETEKPVGEPVGERIIIPTESGFPITLSAGVTEKVGGVEGLKQLLYTRALQQQGNEIIYQAVTAATYGKNVVMRTPEEMIKIQAEDARIAEKASRVETFAYYGMNIPRTSLIGLGALGMLAAGIPIESIRSQEFEMRKQFVREHLESPIGRTAKEMFDIGSFMLLATPKTYSVAMNAIKESAYAQYILPAVKPIIIGASAYIFAKGTFETVGAVIDINKEPDLISYTRLAGGAIQMGGGALGIYAGWKMPSYLTWSEPKFIEKVETGSISRTTVTGKTFVKGMNVSESIGKSNLMYGKYRLPDWIGNKLITSYDFGEFAGAGTRGEIKTGEFSTGFTITKTTYLNKFSSIIFNAPTYLTEGVSISSPISDIMFKSTGTARTAVMINEKIFFGYGGSKIISRMIGEPEILMSIENKETGTITQTVKYKFDVKGLTYNPKLSGIVTGKAEMISIEPVITSASGGGGKGFTISKPPSTSLTFGGTSTFDIVPTNILSQFAETARITSTSQWKLFYPSKTKVYEETIYMTYPNIKNEITQNMQTVMNKSMSSQKLQLDLGSALKSGSQTQSQSGLQLNLGLQNQTITQSQTELTLQQLQQLKLNLQTQQQLHLLQNIRGLKEITVTETPYIFNVKESATRGKEFKIIVKSDFGKPKIFKVSSRILPTASLESLERAFARYGSGSLARGFNIEKIFRNLARSSGLAAEFPAAEFVRGRKRR